MFVADGAPWIWGSVQTLRGMLNLGKIPCKIIELIDFYHAVQHLHAFAELKREWTSKRRKAWVTRQKKLLKEGKVKVLLSNLREEARGSKGKSLIKREMNYFVKNEGRLCYKEVAGLGMPIGSGAIESAVRRVINLRLKGPCIFWSEESAEEMLLLRAYYKSGRWSLLRKMAYEGGLLNAA